MAATEEKLNKPFTVQPEGRLVVDVAGEVKANTSGGSSELATGRNRYGLTALSFAVAGGHLRAVQSLLKQGANVNARDAQGQTPLGIAKRNQDGEINKCLRNNLRGLRSSRLLTIGRG